MLKFGSDIATLQPIHYYPPNSSLSGISSLVPGPSAIIRYSTQMSTSDLFCKLGVDMYNFAGQSIQPGDNRDRARRSQHRLCTTQTVEHSEAS